LGYALAVTVFLLDQITGVIYNHASENYFCTTPAISPIEHCDTEGWNLAASILYSSLVGSTVTGSFIHLAEKLKSYFEQRENSEMKKIVQTISNDFDEPMKRHFVNVIDAHHKKSAPIIKKILFYTYEFSTDALPSWLPALNPDSPKEFWPDLSINSRVGMLILAGGFVFYKLVDFIYDKIFCYSKNEEQTFIIEVEDGTMNEPLLADLAI
jgi:hypothetical protein